MMNRILQGLFVAGSAFVAMACSDDNGTAPDAEMTNSTGSGGGGNSTGGSGATTSSTGGSTASTGGTSSGSNMVAITPDMSGWVEGSTNSVGIQGAWYSYNDCNTSPTNCTMNQVPPEGSFENVGGKMCTSGSTAAVAMESDFSTIWGAGIALDLNNSGGTDGMKMAYNADAEGVVGFSFNITGTAPGLRVNITSVPAGDDSHFVGGMVGENTVLFADAMQGSWVTTKTDLDTTQLLAIQFQIPTVMNQSVDFDFCVENLAAITN